MNTPRICVLGAGGAIGSRLVQALLDQNVMVTAVVRRLETAVRIGRWPVKIEVADLGVICDHELRKILNGHDTVIDCSYSTAADVAENKAQSEHLASSLVSACIKLGIPSLIHFGTISVYPTGLKQVDENVVCSPQNQAYGDGKLLAEQTLLGSKNELNVLILQLPVVIGPFMGWTRSIVQQLADTVLVMPDALDGRCNTLFVDDVIHATILGMDYLDGKAMGSVSERILLSGGDARTWTEIYQAHSTKMLNSDLKLISKSDYFSRISASQLESLPWTQLKKSFSEDGDFRQLVLAQWGVRSLYRLVKRRRGQAGIDQIKSRIATQGSESVGSPTDTLVAAHLVTSFDSMPAISSDKAERLLSYSPQTNFEDSITTSLAWARWAGLSS